MPLLKVAVKNRPEEGFPVTMQRVQFEFAMRQIFLTLLLGCSVETTTKQFNYNPEIVIVDPPQGAVVEEGQLALFTAEVGDINHPDAALQVSWYRDDLLVCDWEVPNDKGESFCRIAFYPGDSLVFCPDREKGEGTIS